MSVIIEFAKSRNRDLLVDAGRRIEDSFGGTNQYYENLILNHIGSLLGVDECEYMEIFQYLESDYLIGDYEKAFAKMDALSEKGYRKATIFVAENVAVSNPTMALNYYSQCLDDPGVNQGELNERMGYLYYNSDMLENKDGIPFLSVAADQYNRGFAQLILAKMYFVGDGVKEDIETSFSYCLKAANNGVDSAEYYLGRDYIFADEYPLEQNIELGIEYLKRAAAKNYANAQYCLGFLYYDGEYVSRDVALSEEYLLQASKNEVPGAFSYLGRLNYERAEYAKAKEYLEVSYQKFELFLCADYLVKIYKNGLAGPVDMPKAVALIDAMIANNTCSVEDVEFAANAYYDGVVVARDVDKAVRYFSLIEEGNTAIKYKLGCIALEGESTVLSRNDCIQYLEYAGNNGFSASFSKLAHYFLSIGNRDRALDYFKRSFYAGNIDDGVMVGRIYESGTLSMQKNINEAVNWYKTAAEKGSIQAQKELKDIKSGFFGYKRI